jgi:hypothetical protein
MPPTQRQAPRSSNGKRIINEEESMLPKPPVKPACVPKTVNGRNQSASNQAKNNGQKDPRKKRKGTCSQLTRSLYPVGACSLGEKCTAKDKELRPTYACIKCKRQLHGITTGCCKVVGDDGHIACTECFKTLNSESQTQESAGRAAPSIVSGQHKTMGQATPRNVSGQSKPMGQSECPGDQSGMRMVSTDKSMTNPMYSDISDSTSRCITRMSGVEKEVVEDMIKKYVETNYKLIQERSGNMTSAEMENKKAFQAGKKSLYKWLKFVESDDLDDADGDVACEVANYMGVFQTTPGSDHELLVMKVKQKEWWDHVKKHVRDGISEARAQSNHQIRSDLQREYYYVKSLQCSN